MAEDIEKWQKKVDETLELTSYCKKIRQGIDELDKNSGERAIWELVQNARDLDTNCSIKIILENDKIIFKHHGTPFDYKSLISLVKQTSSKDDNPNSDQVGQYGTGFMTTHAFNLVIKINGAYQIGETENYVNLDNFILDRSSDKLDDMILEMGKEIELVRQLCKQGASPEPNEWTSFTYDLSTDQIETVSKQIEHALRLMPFVFVINDRIKECEINNTISGKHVIFKKQESNTSVVEPNGWLEISTPIKIEKNGSEDIINCRSLHSADKEDVILLPPFIKDCYDLYDIPSLFIWFPLIGTEQFGINFPFHSNRFYPVEKRNGIVLPKETDKTKKKYEQNERVINEMTDALFAYYKIESHAATLTRDFCRIYFKTEGCEDNATNGFYKRLKSKWVNEIVSWKIIPTVTGKKSLNDGVSVLHPSFYQNLLIEKQRQYEPIMAKYLSNVKEARFLPNEELIEWSKIVAEWGVDLEKYSISLKQVCLSINKNSENLHQFLEILKESGNEGCLIEYPLIPNRKGELKKANELLNGDFMTEERYAIACSLMGSEVEQMVDIKYLDIYQFGDFKTDQLKKSIQGTILTFRNQTTSVKKLFNQQDPIVNLIKYCSAFSSLSVDNIRFRMTKLIAKIFEFTFDPRVIKKASDDEKEDDLYSSAFNFMVEYTMLFISKGNSEWIQKSRNILLQFVTEYTSSKNEEWLKKLDDYKIIPNQNGSLCLKKDLVKNNGIEDELSDIYKETKGEDLKDKFVDVDFESLIEFNLLDSVNVANEIEKILEESLNNHDNKYNSILLKLIPKLVDNSWTTLFPHINEKKESIVFNMKNGEDQKSLFVLMDMDSNDLKRLAELKKTGNISEIIGIMESLKRQEEEQRQKFNFCYRIGKYIEDVLRNKLENDLKVKSRDSADTKLIVQDIQNGQDIIITYDNKDVFYIEIKAKWTFLDPAHMSINQMRMAVKNADKYALCCIDLTNQSSANVPPDATQEYVKEHIREILDNTYVHLTIGDELKDIMTPIMNAESDERKINIGNYQANISQKVFTNGSKFDKLIEAIINSCSVN